MTERETILKFTGDGPFDFPELRNLRVAMTGDRYCMITGELPDQPDQKKRLVQLRVSLESAMQLAALLKRFGEVYGLPLPKGQIGARSFQ